MISRPELNREKWKIQNALLMSITCDSSGGILSYDRLVIFSITMKISWSLMSPTSHLSFIVPLGVAKCPMFGNLEEDVH